MPRHNHTFSKFLVANADGHSCWVGYNLRAISPNQLFTYKDVSISITAPGHADRAYDRIACWIFGNGNGEPDYGILITASDEKGGNANARVIGNFSPSCTYTNSGNDRIITISGLRSWSDYCIISPWKIL